MPSTIETVGAAARAGGDSRDEPERVLKPWEVSVHLDIDQETIYRMLRSGALRAVKIGRQWRIPVSAVDDLISGRTRDSSSTHSAA